MRGFYSIVLMSVLLIGPAVAKGPAPELGFRYLDVHNHLFGTTKDGHDFAGAANTAVGTMDRLGISRMVVMPPPFTVGQSGVHKIDVLLPAIKGHPGRFAFLGGGGSLNPMIQEAVKAGSVSAELKRRFEAEADRLVALGARGFGEMTAEHFSFDSRHPHISAPPDHPLFLLLADIAARHRVPIDLHMEAISADMPTPATLSQRSSQNPKILKGNIAAFERLLAHNRGAPIIWAHAGWDNTGERTVALMRRLLEAHGNLHMTFKIGRESARETMPFQRGGRLKTEWIDLIAAFPGRFLIGSDQFHMTPKTRKRLPRRAEPSKKLLAGLPADVARKVGVDNARRLFGLSD